MALMLVTSACNPLGEIQKVQSTFLAGLTLSVKNSQVSVDSATVSSGGTVTVTLTLKDQNSNVLKRPGVIVSFSNSGGTSTGTFGAVTDNGDGTYSSVFSALTAGTATTIYATANGEAITSTAPTVTVTGGSANAIAVNSGSGASAVVGTTAPFVAIVTDIDGNPLENATVNWAVTGGGGSLSSASNLTNSSGLSASTLTLGTVIGANTVTATVQGTGLTATFTATGTHAAASQIAFGTQPGGGTSSVAWSTQPIVQVKDAFGNLVTTGADATRTITVALTTGTGTLTGTLTKAAVAGVADFSANALKIDLIGTNKVLTASTTITAGAVTVASSSFTVTHAAASQLVFTTQPGGGASSVAWSTQPIVEIRDAQGNLVTTGADATRTITVALTTGTGTLTGTFTKAAVAGVADFSANALKIDLIGTNKVLTASTTITAGAVSQTSNSFTVTHAAASQIAFATQPGGGTAAAAWSTQPIVEVRDAQGNLVTTGADATRTITVALTTGTGTLTGTLTKAAVAGVADFSANALKIELIGTDKVLTGSTTITAGAVSVASSAFTISAGTVSQLVITQEPTDAVAGATISPAITVSARDANGNVNSAYATNLSIAIDTSVSPGGSSLSGTTTRTPSSGVSTFNDISITKAGAGYRLTATDGTLSVNSATFTISTGTAHKDNSTMSVSPCTLLGSASDCTVTSGSSVTLTLTSKDTYNNPLSSGGSTVVLSNSGGTSTGSYAASTADAGDGSYNRSFLGIVPGSASTVTATLGGAAVTTTAPTIKVVEQALTTPYTDLVLNMDAANYNAGTYPGTGGASNCAGTSWTSLSGAPWSGSAGIAGTLTNIGNACGAGTGWSGDGSIATNTDTGVSGTGPYGINFDGTNDYVTFGNATSVRVPKFTIIAWIYRSAAGAGGSTGSSGFEGGANKFPLLTPIVAKGMAQAETDAADVNFNFGVTAAAGSGTNTTPAGVLGLDFENQVPTVGACAGSANNPIVGTTVLSTSKWYFVAVTADYTASKRRIFLDGALEASDSNACQPASSSNNNTILAIGSSRTTANGAGGYFAGNIPIVQIYNRALTVQEIRQNCVARQDRFAKRFGANPLPCVQPASLTKSTIGVNGTTSGNVNISVGGTATVTFTAKDLNATNITNGNSTVVLTIAGANGSIGSVTDVGNGTYTATFTAAGTTATAAAVTGTIDGLALAPTGGAPTITVVP